MGCYLISQIYRHLAGITQNWIIPASPENVAGDTGSPAQVLAGSKVFECGSQISLRHVHIGHDSEPRRPFAGIRSNSPMGSTNREAPETGPIRERFDRASAPGPAPGHPASTRRRATQATEHRASAGRRSLLAVGSLSFYRRAATERQRPGRPSVASSVSFKTAGQESTHDQRATEATELPYI